MGYIVGGLFWILVCFGGCRLLESTMTKDQADAVGKAAQDGANAAAEQIEKVRHRMNDAFKGPRKAAEDFRKNNTFSNWLQANGG